ncbi:hypothetical protein [Speluncibacter jeojiensis]|nr:hypothetical protein [Rhodococcus sp. D2-41]
MFQLFAAALPTNDAQAAQADLAILLGMLTSGSTAGSSASA